MLDELWEVFLQLADAAPHEHVGSVRAPDKEIALQNARDLYARRGNVKSIWIVKSEAIVASTPGDAASFFDPAQDKAYRHPQFYKIPKELKD